VRTEVRAAVTLLVVGCLGALTGFALPHSGGAANPKLTGTFGPGYTIHLTDANGIAVTSLPAGTYDIEVHDTSAAHNFHLLGPGNVDRATDVAGTGDVTWTVTLVPGTYTYRCDPHAYLGMQGTFTVTAAGATSTATPGTSTSATSTGTTTQSTTTAPPTTLPRRPPRCVVPRVVGRPLARARRMLVGARCRTGKVSRRFSLARRGRVLAQHPRAGARRPVGTRVNLVVSRGRRR
jgi:PASTA domain/Copper binding proteins, plastocyanin/azurin family